ncbi:hypothetical protein EVAR_18697_1 [Eumeta japonica]|uniref:Uncharacterized protein n=1 Tax=Eumeta variegata TaxID=151549 RepID=A0A4C1U865_EUMVA|nr:hypothetical protein EVAR_18697_1 [Eumeta japonica]
MKDSGKAIPIQNPCNPYRPLGSECYPLEMLINVPSEWAVSQARAGAARARARLRRRKIYCGPPPPGPLPFLL